jgi:hypothetical protein
LFAIRDSHSLKAVSVSNAYRGKSDREGSFIRTATLLPGDRRKAIRYQMSVRAIFRWKGSRGRRFQQGEGTTRDISVAGVYVLAPICPPANSFLQMEIILPQLPSVRKTRMKAKMKVLRVENLGRKARSGFSAGGKSFSLHNFSKRSFEPITDVEKESVE